MTELSGPMVAILGNIASGKTTLARVVGPLLGLEAIFESPELNPFLPRLSSQPERWCLANQFWYLNHAIGARSRCPASGGIMDHSVEEVVDIHSPVFTRQRWLTEDEMALLTVTSTTLQHATHGIDLFVVLELSIEETLERFHRRGRPADSAPTPEYLAALSRQRELFLERGRVPVCRVQSGDIDFRTSAGAIIAAAEISNAIERLSVE